MPGRQTKSDSRPAYHHGDLKRVLVEAALALVTEEQDWSFSLREVARRAGVSHNAPYNHFADKRDLLDALAAAGFKTLRARLLAAAAEAEGAEAVIVAIGVAYMRFGAENPAHYRLMFGQALTTAEGRLPKAAEAAAMNSKAVLAEAISDGARKGRLAVAPDDQPALDLAILAAWSLVHGLTMLVIDGLAAASSPVFEQVALALIEGLRKR